jgi:hypothetical protein
MILQIVNTTNVTGQVGSAVRSLVGDWSLLLGALILVGIFFVLIFLLKQIIANLVVGVVALLLIKYILGYPIDISALTLLIAALGGAGGAAAVLIATFFGWL